MLSGCSHTHSLTRDQRASHVVVAVFASGANKHEGPPIGGFLFAVVVAGAVLAVGRWERGSDVSTPSTVHDQNQHISRLVVYLDVNSDSATLQSETRGGCQQMTRADLDPMGVQTQTLAKWTPHCDSLTKRILAARRTGSRLTRVSPPRRKHEKRNNSQSFRARSIVGQSAGLRVEEHTFPWETTLPLRGTCYSGETRGVSRW